MDAPPVKDVDPEIERTFKWLMSFIPADEWARRKEAVCKRIGAIENRLAAPAEETGFHTLTEHDDRTAWYLYLVETTLYEPTSTEIHQAARVLPVFSRFGHHLDLLTRIGGVENKVRELFTSYKSQPDSVLFEMLIALTWARNGWKDVAFIPAVKTEKRPDFRAANGGDEWFVETKRMATNPEYSQKERAKWLKMWSCMRDLLVGKRYPFVFDITFHVELDTLSDEFARDTLAGKLPLVNFPCTLIDDSTWTVKVEYVDEERLQEHLSKQYVKRHSRQLQELIGGRWERGRGFSYWMLSKSARVGEGVLNDYIDAISYATGAFWSCDAEVAIQKKARDIRKHLADATDQLPSTGKCAVHVGFETPDGSVVEAERFGRIVETVTHFDAKGKDLRWTFCHLYETYSPVEVSWVCDETVYLFSSAASPNPSPLTNRASVVPEIETSVHDVHWLREAP